MATAEFECHASSRQWTLNRAARDRDSPLPSIRCLVSLRAIQLIPAPVSHGDRRTPPAIQNLHLYFSLAGQHACPLPGAQVPSRNPWARHREFLRPTPATCGPRSGAGDVMPGRGGAPGLRGLWPRPESPPEAGRSGWMTRNRLRGGPTRAVCEEPLPPRRATTMTASDRNSPLTRSRPGRGGGPAAGPSSRTWPAAPQSLIHSRPGGSWWTKCCFGP